MPRQFDVVLSGMSFLECPRWHDGRLWVSDFYTFRVLSLGADDSDLRVEAEVPGQPSGLGWLPDGRLLVVSMRDALILRREQDGSLVTHADLGNRVGAPLNDMVVDRQGRAYVGNFGFDLMSGAPIQSTALIRVDPDGTASVVAEDLVFPNGSVITDEGVLLVGESFANRVSAFDIAADGSLTNRREWATFGAPITTWDFGEALPQMVVVPDGCCLDAAGHLWIADALHSRVVRVAPGGNIVDEIVTETAVFACMLGGGDGRRLFCCLAPDFDEHARSAARDAQLVATTVDVPHAGLP
jgi:sugar lactone lactonase YvrE